jgi:hypothetical protein
MPTPTRRHPVRFQTPFSQNASFGKSRSSSVCPYTTAVHWPVRRILGLAPTRHYVPDQYFIYFREGSAGCPSCSRPAPVQGGGPLRIPMFCARCCVASIPILFYRGPQYSSETTHKPWRHPSRPGPSLLSSIIHRSPSLLGRLP